MTVLRDKTETAGKLCKKSNSLKLWLSFFCLSFIIAFASVSTKNNNNKKTQYSNLYLISQGKCAISLSLASPDKNAKIMTVSKQVSWTVSPSAIGWANRWLCLKLTPLVELVIASFHWDLGLFVRINQQIPYLLSWFLTVKWDKGSISLHL